MPEEETLIYHLMRDNEERYGITVWTRADRLIYAVADSYGECPGEQILHALESPELLSALAHQDPEVHEYYAGDDAEEVRRYAAADMRESLGQDAFRG